MTRRVTTWAAFLALSAQAAFTGPAQCASPAQTHSEPPAEASGIAQSKLMLPSAPPAGTTFAIARDASASRMGAVAGLQSTAALARITTAGTKATAVRKGLLAVADASPKSRSGDSTSGISREGAFWVETVGGFQTIPPKGVLRVSTLGAVSLTGSGGEQVVRYVLVKRVKARTEGDARKMLERFLVRAEHNGDTLSFQVSHGGADGQSADAIDERHPHGRRG